MYALATFLRMMDKSKSVGQPRQNIFVCCECGNEYPKAFKEKCKKCSKCCFCDPADKIVAEKKQMLLDIEKEQAKLKSQKGRKLKLILGMVVFTCVAVIVGTLIVTLS